MMIPKKWFQEDWQRAMELKHAADCRAGKCHLCGVIYRERELCKHMLKRQKQGRIDEQNWQPTPIEKYVEPEPVQRLRFRIGRTGEVRFLSHLEVMNAWVRALRRARAPLSYSQGFHAHPKITFATAAPVGEESIGDYMDIVLKEIADPLELLGRVQATLATGFRAINVEEVPLKAPALMAACSGYAYSLSATAEGETVATRIAEILDAGEILVERDVKVKDWKGRERREKKDIDIRPMIARLEITQSANHQTIIEFDTVIVGGRSARPREIVALLGLDAVSTSILKRDTFLRHNVEQPIALMEV